MRSSDQLRQAFLDYFRARQHTVVPSSSLVPGNDPTLLFTNAGMVQFKDTFLGIDKRPYTRATSCQRCVRAGGKHNDLENVGYTARHHTFFEMLGNFSFGDYFKREAIQFAWDFLIKEMKLPPERLWITVYEDDKEAEDIWLKEMQIDPKRFSRCGAKDNFWSMGDTGPCGPCTEIYYDHGANIPGYPPGHAPEGEDEGDRYIEIWNLVFMQYDRAADGSLKALPKPSVDTGMGFERMAAVMQGVHSNYDIDIFQYLIKAIAALAKTQDLGNKSLRVIADHIRACAFLIADGVVPSNEGRGYVLRRICRRAIRHGHRLGFQEPFFYKLVEPLVVVMGSAYPELKTRAIEVETMLQQEELQFERTLDQGLRILEQDLSLVKDNTLPGETVFKLYDTYGFPVDLTADIARERGMIMDMDGFNTAMAMQRTRAREASKFGLAAADHIEINEVTDFTGYENLEEKAKILNLFVVSQDKTLKDTETLKTGVTAVVVLDHTPFYAEAGGQVGDKGILRSGDNVFDVQNTKKAGQAHMHYGVMRQGTFSLNTVVTAEVDKEKRAATQRNHSATHLLHAALRKILGPHVQQKGSLVEAERLRFDFSHGQALTPEQIQTVQALVNSQTQLNSKVITELMPVDQALEKGAMALFGEKYDREKPLRVLRMGSDPSGDFSIELCGGTHVHSTQDIGYFKIVSQKAVASGIRRLEAITGSYSKKMVEEEARAKNAPLAPVAGQSEIAYLEKLDMETQKLAAEMKQLQDQDRKKAAKPSQTLSNEKVESLKPLKIGTVDVVIAAMPNTNRASLRTVIDHLKTQYPSLVVLLASEEEGNPIVVASVSQDCIEKYQISAGEMVREAAMALGGKGGGRKEMAEGGGGDPQKIPQALETVSLKVMSSLKK